MSLSGSGYHIPDALQTTEEKSGDGIVPSTHSKFATVPSVVPTAVLSLPMDEASLVSRGHVALPLTREESSKHVDSREHISAWNVLLVPFTPLSITKIENSNVPSHLWFRVSL